MNSQKKLKQENILKKLIFILSLFILNVQAATQIKDFKLKDLENRYVSLSELKGEKLTIIDFWATWCKPCIKAIPNLNKIYKSYKEQGLEVIGINVDSPRNSAKVKPFIKTYKMEYAVLRDPNSQLATELNVSAYPTLYLINAQNEIVYTHIGYHSGEEKLLIREIEKQLNEDK